MRAVKAALTAGIQDQYPFAECGRKWFEVERGENVQVNVQKQGPAVRSGCHT
jgi:galactokinase/mevalonate kinase-like predicted kinase